MLIETQRPNDTASTIGSVRAEIVWHGTASPSADLL